MSNDRTVKEITFDIQGEFINQMAKEWFFVENRGYDKVMELLLSCMEGTEQSEKELKRLGEDILLGRAALVGSTRDNTYHMEVYEPDEQPEQPEWFNVFRKMSDLMSKLKNTEKELQKMQGWYAVAMEHVPEYRSKVVEEVVELMAEIYLPVCPVFEYRIHQRAVSRDMLHNRLLGLREKPGGKQKNKFSNFSQRSYDYEELERALLRSQ